MFDFLLNKEERNKRQFYTNYKIAYDLIPKKCEAICNEGACIESLWDLSAIKKELKAEMSEDLYGGNMPECSHKQTELKGENMLLIGYHFCFTGMPTEPVYLFGLLDLKHNNYSLFTLEKEVIPNSYCICSVDSSTHGYCGVTYKGLKLEEFMKDVTKMAFDSLMKARKPRTIKDYYIPSAPAQEDIEESNPPKKELDKCSLLDFVKKHGQPRYVEDFKDKDGSVFAAISFESKSFNTDEIKDILDRNGIKRKSGFVIVRFTFPDLYTFDYITEHAKELQVIKFAPDARHSYPSFYLCNKDVDSEICAVTQHYKHPELDESDNDNFDLPF